MLIVMPAEPGQYKLKAAPFRVTLKLRWAVITLLEPLLDPVSLFPFVF